MPNPETVPPADVIHATHHRQKVSQQPQEVLLGQVHRGSALLAHAVLEGRHWHFLSACGDLRLVLHGAACPDALRAGSAGVAALRLQFS
jgi:hypothetical protein